MIGLDGDDTMYSPSPETPKSSPEGLDHDKSLASMDSPESQEDTSSAKKKKKGRRKKDSPDKRGEGKLSFAVTACLLVSRKGRVGCNTGSDLMCVKYKHLSCTMYITDLKMIRI